MDIKDIIIIKNNETRAGSWLIAQGFAKEHKKLLQLIRKYQVIFEDFGRLEKHQFESTGGRPVIEFLLNKSQCLLLAGFLRTSKLKIQFLSLLIENFDKIDKNLKEILQAIDAFDFDDIDVRYIYAAQDSLGRLKIGISNNPERRLKELNIGNADELKLVYVKDTIKPRYGDEIDIHNNASEYCIKGEWFKPEAMQCLQ